MYSFFKNSLLAVTKDCNNGDFSPILEDDFVSRVYFHLLKCNYNKFSRRTYIKTRVLGNINGLNDRCKYDIVIGDVVHDNHTKPYVVPDLISEFKIFPIGFKPQQLSKRRNHVIDDMYKLNEIYRCYKRKVLLLISLFDDISWLEKYNRNLQVNGINRLEHFIAERDKINRNIKILLIRKNEQNRYELIEK